MSFYAMPDGESLFVREIGQGQPVLILSGLGMQSWQWIPYLLPNLKNYRFIIPDWRGFGGSKHCKIPNDLNAIQSHWSDVECLIKQLALTDFILIAYSMGATTAMHGMQYAKLGEQLKAYLHIDQTPKIPSDANWPYGLFGKKYPKFMQLLQKMSDFLTEHQHLERIEQLETQPRQTLIKMWLRFIQLQGSNKLSPLLFKLALKRPKLQKHLLPMQRLDYLSWYIRNYLEHDQDYRQAITDLRCPTTFFIGERSSLYAAQGQIQIAQGLAQSQQIMFKHSGHTPLLTEPFKFSRELSSFLNQSH